MSEIQPALLTRSELEWLLGKTSNLSKKTERDLRHRINKKLRIFMHTELPLLKDRGFTAAVGNAAAAISSGCTVRSSIVDARVSPNQTKSKPKEAEEHENRMLRPGFESGISDSKGRYCCHFFL
jgi:hypothetical protein